MRILFIFLLTASSMVSQAQLISGGVKDETGNPLPGATVQLLSASDSASVKLAVTDKNGFFSFPGIREGQYRIRTSHVGFQDSYSSSFVLVHHDIEVPGFQLSKVQGKLNNVNVVARKPMVEVKADKTILNVEGTINAVGSNAFELLRKSPGILIDRDDQMMMAGKTGIQVYIDGRPSPLTGQELANYLKTLQSSQVEAIELITNPSAKYDAAGNAGIINIRLVRNKSLGMNGSVNAGWNMGMTAKYNAGFALNYRNKNLNIFSNYSYAFMPNRQTITVYRTVLDSLFDQTSKMFDRRRSHNYKAGIDYFFNKKNTIGLVVNGTLSNSFNESEGRTFISNNLTKSTDRILVADNSNRMKRSNTAINLNYSYAGSKSSLSLNADKGRYDMNSDQGLENYYYNAAGQVKLDEVIYRIISPAEIEINSLKGDYEYNCGKGKLGVGFKTAWINTDNDFRRYNTSSSGEELDRGRSNHFIYKENINAGYVSFNRQYKKFMVQAGLRVEKTNTEGISDGLKLTGTGYEAYASVFSRAYTDFFPSASLTFNKNPMKQWSVSYSRRIDRPAYQDLNPFEFRLDEYTFMKGNINLQPQYTNSFGLTHVYQYKLNISLNYSHVKDMFARIFDTVESSKAFVSKRNLASQDILNLSISYPFQYKSYSLFTSISSNYSKYKADFGAGRQVELDAVGFNLFLQNSLKITKTWTAELSGFYNAPTIYMGNFKGESVYSLDAGLSKIFMKGRATVKASVSDIFQTMRFSGVSDFAGQVMRFSYRQESRQFKLALSYRFGNNGVKAARQRASGAEDELKRVQQGGGVLGN